MWISGKAPPSSKSFSDRGTNRLVADALSLLLLALLIFLLAASSDAARHRSSYDGAASTDALARTEELLFRGATTPPGALGLDDGPVRVGAGNHKDVILFSNVYVNSDVM
jgi:hypothetical protein